jgi:4-oxalmesaconate hydratase
MIIDCHGHLTTEPSALLDFRRGQLDHFAGAGSEPGPLEIDDDDLRSVIENGALRLQGERGTDLTLFSPRASGMRHDIDDVDVAREWARASNLVIERVVELFPSNFAGVAQLPQTPSGDLGHVLDELERSAEAGFVGCNVNPDPGGVWASPPLTDAWWDPLWSALERLDMTAMIHASASTSAAVHTTGAHYLAADTVAFMQLVEGDLFQRHPALRVGAGSAASPSPRERATSPTTCSATSSSTPASTTRRESIC